ncbi:hypothetical protein B0H16DRAFT_338248 [Mycena metata]|uniref:BRCT domain-containing protein n=1 Tax=Mycena metata TaxID=1033252 RepID=A0AAD7NN95_9AGAR|nr:hypothetical protein B0H16DRAFT_338248 [Mycena metata]
MALAIFERVIYYIDGCSNADQIVRLLDIHGGKRTRTRKSATRIIVEPARFEEMNKKGSRAILVTPEWVYSSMKAGKKRPGEYYSPDPSLFFSSVVISAVGLSAQQVDDVRTAISICGGQWAPTITDEITHLIVGPTPGIELDLRPIHVSLGWFLDCRDQGVLLPASSGQSPQPCELGNPSFSAAQRFCESHLSELIVPARGHPSSRVGTQPPHRPLPVLPVELLTRIFIEFRDISQGSWLPHPMAALLPITQVSVRWRTIAHSTTALWTQITLNFHTKSSSVAFIGSLESGRYEVGRSLYR